MTLANVSNQLLKSQGNDTTTVAANYPITGDGSTQLPLGLAEDYRGADGESLTFNITDIDNGHQVNISGSQGSSSFNVLNGQDGADGINGVNGADGQSVTFDIFNIANGHRVTLSGAQVSTSFDVMNGQNGVDGISPTFRFVENEDGVIVFVSGAQGEESFTLYNATGGEGATYSAGPNINITDNTISGKDWSDELSAKLDTTAFSLPNSGNWDNTYNTVNSNSANWSNATTYTAGPNIDITNDVISGRDWTNEIDAKLDTTAFNLPTSATWDDTYNTVSSNSASWNEVNEYSAGSNIDITDNTISGKDWTDELNAKLDATSFTLPTSALWDNTYNTVLANSATWNATGSTYTAGPNIDITDYTISGKDWTDDISAACQEVIQMIPDYSAGPNIDITNNLISGKDWTAEIESAISSVSSNYYPMTGNPSGFLTAHQDITNLPYVQNIALNYTPSTLVSGISGHELYAESANHAFTAETAKYVESGWEYNDNKITAYNGSAFSAGSTYDVTAGANIDVTTAGSTFGISGKDWTETINAASAYAASQGTTYTGVAPIVVNNSEDKISADCIELSAGNGIDADKLATGVIEVSSQGGGSDFVMIDATTSYSAIGLYDQFNDPGCYQIFGTANDGSTPGNSFGYTLPTQSRLFSANCVDSAKNYTNSAISAHIMYVNYGELVAGSVTFANIRTCINNGGIVIPYEINLQSDNYKIYNYELSGVNSNTTGYTFGRFEADGKHQYMVISSYNFGATTGCITANEKLYATPNDVAVVDRIVLVATSGDIPASGETDNKVYIVTGTE